MGKGREVGRGKGLGSEARGRGKGRGETSARGFVSDTSQQWAGLSCHLKA